MVLNYTRYREFTYSGSKEAIKKRKQRDKRGHKGDMSTKGGDISASASASASASVIQEVVSFLNEKTGKSFSPKSKPTIEHISARIAEGRKLDDFKKVINIKVAKWKGRTWPDTRKGREGQIVSGDDYLRPSTLFLPANFENYLNESPTPAKVKKTLRVLQRDGSYETVEVEE
jgi:uncharacterized phage protein (TIGR02220 family)